MTIFVTGGHGFVGSAVVRKLVGAGHTVRCLVREGSHTGRIDDLTWDRITGDLRDAAALRLGSRGADAIVHLASPSSWNDIDSPLMRQVAVGGTRGLLQAAQDAGNVRVVFVSSIVAINGSAKPHVFNENDEWTLSEHRLSYANAKREAETVCAEYV